MAELGFESLPDPTRANHGRQSSVRGWPWLEPGDEAAAAGVSSALHAAGLLASRDEAWLSSALKRAHGASSRHAVPWSSWTMRLCKRAGVADAAGVAAAAVAAVCVRDVEGAPDDLARCAVAVQLLGRVADPHRLHAWMLLLGEHRPATALLNPTDAERRAAEVAAPAGVREAVALCTAPALVAGEDLRSWARFGEALAEPLWLLEGLVRLWLDPAAPDLDPPALTALCAVWLEVPERAEVLLRAYAGERASPARRVEIKSIVASRPFRQAVAERARAALAGARRTLPADHGQRLAAAAAELVDELSEQVDFFESLMSVRALLSPAPRPVACPVAGSSPAADVRAAIDWLLERAPWTGSWEMQRFGILGSEEQPVAQWFVRGTVLHALLEMGCDVHAEIRALLREIPPGELRYYGPWRGIAPDADDLGLMLALAAAVREPPALAESWIQVMMANVGPDGIVPTWFHRLPDGTMYEGALRGGDDCPAVRLNLIAGLLSFDPVRFNHMIQQNARRVIEAFGPDWPDRPDRVDGLCYYDASFAALAFCRVARLYRQRAHTRPLAAAMAALEADLRDRAARAQRFDGGWESPQRTAEFLEMSAIGAALDRGTRERGVPTRVDRLLLERGARYLGEHQLADGSWAPEPLYLIPMKAGRTGMHRGQALTTAMCARSLWTSFRGG